MPVVAVIVEQKEQLVGINATRGAPCTTLVGVGLCAYPGQTQRSAPTKGFDWCQQLQHIDATRGDVCIAQEDQCNRITKGLVLKVQRNSVGGETPP